MLAAPADKTVNIFTLCAYSLVSPCSTFDFQLLCGTIFVIRQSFPSCLQQ
jgi:hypothetical protein